MKFTVITFISMCSIMVGKLATDAGIFRKLGDLYDQFNKAFDTKIVDDRLTIVYIPGKDNPFGRVYDKLKGKEIKEGIQFIGGFKEMMAKMDRDAKKKHLQEAFVHRYGKRHFTILLDLDSEIQEMLNLDGYGVIILAKKDGQVLEQLDFGTDRGGFFKELQQYLK